MDPLSLFLVGGKESDYVMKTKHGAFFTILIMLFSLGIVLGAFTYPYQAARRIPIIVGIAVFALATIALIRELWSKKEESSGAEEEPSLISYWKTGAWVCGVGLLIYLVGFLVALPLFIIVYLKLNGTGWKRSTIVAVITTGVIYGLFELILKFELYRGVFFNL
jgi:hypothetical protein